MPNERMDLDLPGYAWDLLLYKNKPFDLYRSPLWHAEYIEENRSRMLLFKHLLDVSFNVTSV